MVIKFEPHAIIRMRQRGTEEAEVEETINNGEKTPAKYGRSGFKMDFTYKAKWNNKYYETKQVTTYVEQENDSLIVITVITKFC